MITMLSREWPAISQNDIKTITGKMRRQYTACMQADGGHTSNKTFVIIENDPYPVLLQFECVLNPNEGNS